MASCLKHLEKHSLMARRKNNTASKMLEEKLKHLEQKFNREYKQYLRVKSRVQSELRIIEDVASDYDEDTTSKSAESPPAEEHHALDLSRYPGFDLRTNQSKKSELPTENKALVIYPNWSKTRSPSFNNSPNILNPILERTSVDWNGPLKNGGSQPKEACLLSSKVHCNDKQLPSFPAGVARSHIVSGESYLVPDSTVGVNNSTTRVNSRASQPSVWTSDVLCKYSSHSQACHCRSFPCVKPKTYHTIGQGCKEVNHVTDVRRDSGTGKLATASAAKALQKARNHTSPKPTLAAIVGLQNSSQKTADLTSNLGHTADVFGLRTRPGNEFGFRPATSEPRLKRTSSRATEFQTEETNRARVTIKDKMRGLKQIVSEMRAKNEQNKPRDWAVNYGQQFPPRILLNPVMP
ncbi:hypothetical protein BsWGS_01147 [Bradybaena similaris]